MHPLIFREFEKICSQHGPYNRILEIGVTLEDQPLLTLPSLPKTALKIGIDQKGGFRSDNYIVLQANAHQVSFFRERSFDLILCNSVLEHDPAFWLTLQEIRRLARPGALLVLGVPGYGPMGGQFGLALLRRLVKLPGLGTRWKKELEAVEASSSTLGLHAYPADYYRFSEQAVKEIFLEGLLHAQTCVVMQPPRILGWGFMPGIPI